VGSRPSTFWHIYSTARAIALGTPTAYEDVTRRRFTLAYRRAFGGNAVEIERMAERHVLYMREAEMHAVVAFHPQSAMIRGLVENAFMVGVDRLASLEGSIVVATHFSHCYMLAFTLGHAAHERELGPIAILARSPEQGLRFSSAWYSALAHHDVACDRCLTVIDTTELGPRRALAKLKDFISSGATVVIYADGTVLPARKRGINVVVGRATVTFPYGAAKLAEISGRPLVGARVCERDDRIGLAFSAPVEVDAEGGGPVVTGLVQKLFDDAMAEDPVRWQQWASLGAQIEAEDQGARSTNAARASMKPE
jgi:hypothetical protein